MMKSHRTEEQDIIHKQQQKESKQKKQELQDPLLEPDKISKVQTSLKKLKKNLSNLEKEDPIFTLGYGIVAYRDIMWSMIITFAIFTFLMIPQRIIFRKYTNEDDKYGDKYGSLMLNSLGYSTVSCFNLPIEIGMIVAGCDYGEIG